MTEGKAFKSSKIFISNANVKESTEKFKTDDIAIKPFDKTWQNLIFNNASRASESNSKKGCKIMNPKVIKPGSTWQKNTEVLFDKTELKIDSENENDDDIKNIWNLDLYLEVREDTKQDECLFCNKKFYHSCDLEKHIDYYECFPDNFLMPLPTNMGLAALQEVEKSRQQNYPEAIKTGTTDFTTKIIIPHKKTNTASIVSIPEYSEEVEINKTEKAYHLQGCANSGQFRSLKDAEVNKTERAINSLPDYDSQERKIKNEKATQLALAQPKNEKKQESSHAGDVRESSDQLIPGFLKKQFSLFNLAISEGARVPRASQVPPSLPMIREIYDEKKQYKCSKCVSSFPTKTNLNTHIASDHEGKKRLISSVHEGKKPLKCGICENSFSKKDDLKKHIESAHEKKKSFKCELCNYICNQTANMTHHLLSVHKKKKPFKCDICDYISSRKSHLEKHIESVHEKKKPFECDICVYSCNQKANMTQHVLSVHDKKKPFKCDFCYYICAQKVDMTLHVASVHEKKRPFQCIICDYKCYQKDSMTEHVESAHERMKKSFNCNTCKMIFQRKDKFEKHVNIVHKGKWFPCKQCDAHFGFKTLLIEHGMRIHDLKGPFPCNFCKETFATNGERNTHQLRCKDPLKYPFICGICHARFASKKSATVHEKNKKIHPSPDRACVSTDASGASKLV